MNNTTLSSYTTSRPWTVTTEGMQSTSDMGTTSGYEATPSPRSCPPQEWGGEGLRIYYIEVSCLASIFAMATFGNICVLLALWRRRSNTNRMHLFIMHLAISDLVVAFFQVLPELIVRLSCGFHASNSTCKFYKYMQILGMYGSTYVLICTAFDRFFAIRYPMKSLRMSRRFVHCTVLAAWCVSALLAIPQIILFKKLGTDPYCEMSNDPTISKASALWYFFMILVIPTFLLGYFYGMIARTVVRNAQQKKRLKDNPNQDSHGNEGGRGRKEFTPRASGVGVISRAKIKTVKMTFVIVITFVFCWTPFYTAQLIGAFNPTAIQSNVGSQIIFLIGSLNSCTNPWIYLFFSGSLLKELKRQYCCYQGRAEGNRSRYFPQTDQATTHSYVTETIKVEMVALNSSCKPSAPTTTITTVNDVD